MLRRSAEEDAKDVAGAALWAAGLHMCRRLSKTVSSRAGSTGWQGGYMARQRKRRTLSKFEFAHFLKGIKFKPALAPRVFRLLDTSGDGEVGGPEFRDAIGLMTDRGRRRERISFLFRLIDPAGSGQLCQRQVSGRPGASRELDEATVLFFLEKFFVLEDDTIDVVLGAGASRPCATPVP